MHSCLYSKKMFLLLSLPFLFSSNQSFGEKIKRIYEETTNGTTTQTVWSINLGEKEWKLQSESPFGTTTVIMTPDSTTKEFRYVAKDKSKTYQIQQGEQKIDANGTFNGDGKNVEYKLDKYPWLQEFGFGLRPLLISEEPEYRFVILNPHDLTMNKMVAKKKDIEEIEIKGKKYKAQKVIVTLQGFKSMFWEGEVWFDSTTHVLLKYVANEGPNTETTTTLLVKNETE